MLITAETKEGIGNLLGGLGVVVIILGIFTDYIEFGLAIVIAVFFWMLADLFKTWIKIDKTTNKSSFRNRKAFIKLLSLLGVWVILFAIFTDYISFNLAIVVAVTFFIFSGVFSEFFGISKTSRHKRRYVSTTPSNNVEDIGYTIENEDYFDEGPAKIKCGNCGNTLIKGDIFCSGCGEKTN